MENIIKDNFAEHTPLTEDIDQSRIDKWDRSSNVVLSLLQRMEQVEAFVEEQKNKEWKSKITIPSTFISSSIDIPLNIRTTFEKLEEDFSDFSNRIVWCNELKNCLSKLEEELEEYDAKYLSWFVSTLKDVFSYNYAETITEEQLDLLKNGIETIYEKQENCDKDTFAEYHLQLVESGLSLLPTTKKAIEEFGE
jgi:hypothetical protein